MPLARYVKAYRLATPLQFFFLLDWAKLSGTFGFPAHFDTLRPCFKCNCTRDNMHDTETASAVALPWRENDRGDYAAACSRCELVVTLTQPDHAAVCDALSDYDRRLDGAVGRALGRDVAVDGVVLRVTVWSPVGPSLTLVSLMRWLLFPLVGVVFLAAQQGVSRSPSQSNFRS